MDAAVVILVLTGIVALGVYLGIRAGLANPKPNPEAQEHEEMNSAR